MAAPEAQVPDATPPSSPAPPEYRRGRFLLALLLIALVGGAIRVGYVVVAKRHDPLVGDQIYYSAMADTLARGEGFRDPFIRDRTVPSADHPPLTAIVMVPASLLSDDPETVVLLQRLLMCVIGAAGVFAVGMAARQAAPRRRRDAVGYTAAGLAAIYPGFWINDGLIMSESLGVLTVATAIWATYRMLDAPSARRVALLGAVIGFAALTRAEALLLAPLLVVGVVLTRRVPRAERPQPRQRMKWFAAGTAACVLVLAPWVGPNITRFNDPTTLSTNDGLTLLGTNCDPAWNGSSKGLWVLSCIRAVDSDRDGVDDWDEFVRGTDRLGPHQDWSEVSTLYRRAGFDYLRAHLRDLPSVVLVREARLWGVYGVGGMVFYNTGEGRETWASWAAVVGYWLLLLPALAGLVILRRTERPVWPLIVQFAAAAITAAAFYGLWRFRIGAEVTLVIAASVAVVSAFDAMAPGRLRP